MMTFGLLGENLTHSFSKTYFENKFRKEDIKEVVYQLFEYNDVKSFCNFINKSQDIHGFNVTIPYKQQIIPFLDSMDESAVKVGAVNVVKIIVKGGIRHKIGYNTDYLAFKNSLQNWLKGATISALVLGTGGAAKAVCAALEDLQIKFRTVSRTNGDLSYSDVNERIEIIAKHRLVINTTPLGMYPNVESKPLLPYELLTKSHYLYDLVYNPEITSFLKNGLLTGAQIKNGMEMLHQQAEYSWDIWNS